MIKAVVFDVDGVLVESMVFARVLEQQYRISREMTSGFFEGPFKDCILGAADLLEALPLYLRQWNWQGSIDAFLRFWFEADSRINIQMMELIESLRSSGIKCYVASTQEARRASYLEHEMGFGGRFDGLFFSCSLGCEKPDPEFYSIVQSRTGIAPRDILFIDDREANVEGARAMGWNAERYAIGYRIESITERYLIRRNVYCMAHPLLDEIKVDNNPADYLKKVGRVFAEFGAPVQDSGNVSYGVEVDGGRYFVKTAGDPNDSKTFLGHAERVELLRNAARVARSCKHPALAQLLQVIESPIGPVLVYEWVEGELLRAAGAFREDPDSAFQRFRKLPCRQIEECLTQVYELHRNLARAGWIAVDFYDGSLMVDFKSGRVKVMDVDHYHMGPFRNEMGRMFGSKRFMAPDDFVLHHGDVRRGAAESDDAQFKEEERKVAQGGLTVRRRRLKRIRAHYRTLILLLVMLSFLQDYTAFG